MLEKEMTKEKLQKLKSEITETLLRTTASDKNLSDNITNISLSTKVDDYIKWYYGNIEYDDSAQLRNLIEKIAVWYELRYPSYEIGKRMPCSGNEMKSINNIMFNDNHYINEVLEEKKDVKTLDWDKFYNSEVFFKSLPFEDSYRFERAKYKEEICIDPGKSTYLYLNPDGYVQKAEGIDRLSNNKISNDQLKGMYVTGVVALLKENEITLPEYNLLELSVLKVENFKKEINGLLDAVMYRIIERGGNRIGPRRAFLFAKEFGRNIDIPMMYAIDCSDPGLRLFINEYLKSGGSKDLECYVNYFNRILRNEKINTITIQEVLSTQNCKTEKFNMPEEHELHKRLVNILSSNVDPEKLKKEEKDKIKQLRIQRKLEESKHNK